MAGAFRLRRAFCRRLVNGAPPPINRTITLGVSAGGGAASVGYSIDTPIGSLSSDVFLGYTIATLLSFDNGAGNNSFSISVLNASAPADLFDKITFDTVHLGTIELLRSAASTSTSASRRTWSWNTTPTMYWREIDGGQTLAWVIE